VAHKLGGKSTSLFKKPSITINVHDERVRKILRLLFFWALAWLTLEAFFLSEVLKDNNYLEFYPNRIVFPLLLHTLTSFFIALVVWLLPRPRTTGTKSITVIFLALCTVNYDTRLMSVVGIFRALLPILPQPDNDIPIISLLFILMLLGIAVLIGIFVDKLLIKHKNITSKNIAEALAVLVGFLFLGQAIPVIRIFAQTLPESSHRPAAELQQVSKMHPVTSPNKPDIYYIVMEDYENNSVLKDQFGANNNKFMDWLRSQNFDVNESALSQYPFTASSVASAMNMSYHNDDLKKFKNNNTQSATLFFNMTRQAEVVKLLKQQGYTYNFLGNPYGAFDSAPLADNVYTSVDHTVKVFGLAKNLRGIDVNDYLQSPYYRFSNVPLKWWPIKMNQTDPVGFIHDQLTSLDDLANAKQQGGRFVFADILAPHVPSYLNADCSISMNPGIDNGGKPIKQKYFDEMQCMNTQIKKIISDINKNSSGQAVVLLVSDEGQYPVNINQTLLQPATPTAVNDDIFDGSMLGWSRKDLQMKYGILQAVHIPGANNGDLQQMSPVNMFRVVLNRYFNYKYNYLPNCQFAVTDGRRDWYKYFDATKKVTGSENSSCKQYE
jgi:hypothetical protein